MSGLQQCWQQGLWAVPGSCQWHLQQQLLLGEPLRREACMHGWALIQKGALKPALVTAYRMQATVHLLHGATVWQ